MGIHNISSNLIGFVRNLCRGLDTHTAYLREQTDESSKVPAHWFFGANAISRPYVSRIESKTAFARFRYIERQDNRSAQFPRERFNVGL